MVIYQRILFGVLVLLGSGCITLRGMDNPISPTQYKQLLASEDQVPALARQIIEATAKWWPETYKNGQPIVTWNKERKVIEQAPECKNREIHDALHNFIVCKILYPVLYPCTREPVGAWAVRGYKDIWPIRFTMCFTRSKLFLEHLREQGLFGDKNSSTALYLLSSLDSLYYKNDWLFAERLSDLEFDVEGAKDVLHSSYIPTDVTEKKFYEQQIRYIFDYTLSQTRWLRWRVPIIGTCVAVATCIGCWAVYKKYYTTDAKEENDEEKDNQKDQTIGRPSEGI